MCVILFERCLISNHVRSDFYYFREMHWFNHELQRTSLYSVVKCCHLLHKTWLKTTLQTKIFLQQWLYFVHISGRKNALDTIKDMWQYHSLCFASSQQTGNILRTFRQGSLKVVTNVPPVMLTERLLKMIWCSQKVGRKTLFIHCSLP